MKGAQEKAQDNPIRLDITSQSMDSKRFLDR